MFDRNFQALGESVLQIHVFDGSAGCSCTFYLHNNNGGVWRYWRCLLLRSELYLCVRFLRTLYVLFMPFYLNQRGCY